MKKSPLAALSAIALALSAGAAHADVTLGTYDFNSAQFGNSLGESDGGAFSSRNWLNTSNFDPGNPAYLTGANFETGIANIGYDGNPPVYTIGYGSWITNGTGADLGVVTAQYSTGDSISLAVSTDGVNFTSALTYGPGLASSTGVGKTYYYGGGGPYGATLFVTSINLDDFGLGAGQTIQAVRISGSPQLDLIRVAGFATSVPEADSLAMMIAGLGLVGALARRRRAV